MKSFTPLNSSLISLQITPQKQLVDYEINSWMQTNDKRKRVPSLYIKPEKNCIPIQPTNRTSLASLRQKRLDLLKNSIKKYHKNIVPINILNSKYELKTAATPSTQFPFSLHSISQQLHSKSTKSKELKAPIIEVSEFKADTKELPQLNTSKKLKELFKAKTGQHFRKASAEIKSNVILQVKVTENSYKRMSFVSKKFVKLN